jgi:PAS domain S-box-containing protein
VAERTADLRRVNEQLRAENAERKRAEDALQRSEAYLAETQRISHTGSFGWHVSSGELFWSDETYRIAGVDRATRPTVEQVLQRIHPEDVVFVQETLDRASRDGTDLDVEHRFLMPDGSVTYVHVVAHAMRDEQGDLAYVGAVTDVTVATRSQQALERTFQDMQALKDQHRLVIDTIPGLVWSTLPDGHADFLTQRWLDYTGLSLAEAQGWGWTAALHPEDRAGFVEKWRTALTTGEPWEAEARWRRTDGEYRWFHVRSVALRDESGNIVRWYAASTDIDDRKRAEEQLLLTKYSIDHSADYAFWAAPDARLVFVNDAGSNALGYTRDELLKLTVHDINPEFPREAWEDHWKGLRASQSLCLESKLRRKNGEIFPVELSLNYLLYNGQEYGFCFARDITQRQQRDEEMQRLTTRGLQLQDEERRRIARDLHDVTAQDLGAVAVNLALLRRLVTDLKSEAQNLVTESASLAEAVLQQIRTLSYLLHPPLLDQVGLASALRWYVEGFTKRSGIHVDIEIARDIGRPSLDIETALFRIVQESLTNVHRHSGSGSATIRLVRAGERMALYVKDQGVGMIEAATGAIADHVQSLGLGILGMRQRLRQFGGQLEIHTSHHGTEIIATVPLTSAPTGQPGQGQRLGE